MGRPRNWHRWGVRLRVYRSEWPEVKMTVALKLGMELELGMEMKLLAGSKFAVELKRLPAGGDVGIPGRLSNALR